MRKNKLFLNKVRGIREWFKDYKSQCTCANCGKKETIEFHHIGKKRTKIARLVRVATSIEEVKNELEKCIPLCNNCHKVEHERLKNGTKSV